MSTPFYPMYGTPFYPRGGIGRQGGEGRRERVCVLEEVERKLGVEKEKV